MRSAQRSMCAAMLTLQAIVLGLSTPVMIGVAGIAVPTALAAGLGLTAGCLLAAGMLRHRWAYGLGWAIQAASLALGFAVTMMFLLGVIFASLWAGAYFLGAKVDRERQERAVLEERWAAEHGDNHAG